VILATLEFWLRLVPLVLTVSSARGEARVPVRAERGFPALAVAQLAPVLSVGVTPLTEGGAAVDVLGRTFTFVTEAPYFRFEGRVYPLAAPPYVSRDSLFVPLQWVADFLPRLLAGRFRYDAEHARLEETGGAPVAAAPPRPTPASAAPAAGARRRRVVALDPGHGGRDDGMSGPVGRRHFLREKDVTLAIARELRRELERRGVRVVMTRNHDTLVAVRDRGRIASARGADVFVSIHVNAANPAWRDAGGARGFETYFLAEARTEDAARVARMENESVRFETSAEAPTGDPLSFILHDLAQNEHLRESSRLAEIVQEELGRVHPAESRGVKQAGLIVLTTTFMPAVLVEVGFGSNEAEARYLVSGAGQRRLALGIAAALERYLAEYERRVAAGEPGQPR
jgi:N-acetylmuramoyl-L-alanine amidase